MINFIHINKKVLILIGILVLLITVLIVFILSRRAINENFFDNQQGPSSIPSSSITPLERNVSVSKVVPENSLISPDQIQDFIITFDGVVRINNFYISLTERDLASDNKVTITETNLSISGEQTSLIIATQSPTKQFHEYLLTILDSSRNVLLQKKYVTDYSIPVRAEGNNLDLVRYLPFETDLFKLSYISTINRYVFNFKLDYNRSDSPEVQFNKAQQQALDFVRSKGIDPDTLVLDWKYY